MEERRSREDYLKGPDRHLLSHLYSEHEDVRGLVSCGICKLMLKAWTSDRLVFSARKDLDSLREKESTVKIEVGEQNMSSYQICGVPVIRYLTLAAGAEIRGTNAVGP